MKIALTHAESLDFFYNALCNGLTLWPGYGLGFEYDEKEYMTSRKRIHGEPCWEDVLIQMLKDGYKLTTVDIEGKGEYTRTIGIMDVYRRVKKTPLHHLVDMQRGNDDAITADAILQTVFFNNIIFG